MLESFYYLGGLMAIAWLLYWSILAERNPDKFENAWPYAPRDADDYHKAFGDHLPF